MNRLLRWAAVAAVLTGLGAGLPVTLPAQAKPAVLTVDQMRAFGIEALARGYAEQGLGIAEALLARDPDDSSAYALKAQALRMLQRLPDSEAAARQAWAKADTEGERYTAASAVAQALSLQGHRTRAQFWLRRAVQDAPNSAARQQALQDFDYVRGQNPLNLQFDLSVRPSDNVNGGARDPLFEYQGIPFVLSGDAQALSGLSLGFGMQGKYRLSDTTAGVTALNFAFSQQSVLLSDAARAKAPMARNGDYALSHIEAGVEREFALPIGLTTAGLTAGHTWYGGADLSNSLAGELTLERPVAGGRGSFSFEVTRQNRLDLALSSSTEAALGAVLSKQGPKGDSWQGSVSVARIVSDDIGIDHAEATLALGWQAKAPILGLDLGGSLSLRGADYAASPYTATGRQDLRWAASLSAQVAKISYLGFAPVLSLDFSRNDSNISLYDSQTVGLSLSVKSRF